MSFSLGTIRSSHRRQSDSTKYKNTKNLVLENIARQFKKKKTCKTKDHAPENAAECRDHKHYVTRINKYFSFLALVPPIYFNHININIMH